MKKVITQRNREREFYEILSGIKDSHIPKSIYAILDCIKCFCTDKPNALIVDFFAGSGTTMHAVNLLNAEDGGHRRCIMVTNNEVSADEAKMLKDKGYQPAMQNGKSLASPTMLLGHARSVPSRGTM